MGPILTDLSKLDSPTENWSLPFSREDWERTPPAVRLYLAALLGKIHELQKALNASLKRVEELEVRINRNSSHSSKPPSSDSPFQKKPGKKSGGRLGAKKGHKGTR